jgi:DNA invertase Pin-like site-specific DNA recombinase
MRSDRNLPQRHLNLTTCGRGRNKGIWGGLTGPERRALQSGWLRAARRDRDGAILAAATAGFTAEAIGRSFGLSRMTVTRIVRRGNRGACAEPDRLASQTPPLREGGR